MQHGQHVCQLCQLSVSVCNPGDLAGGKHALALQGTASEATSLVGAGCSPVGAARHGNKGIADRLNLKKRQATDRELAGCK